MLYLIPAATAGMAGYMMWLLVFRLRHDRVRTERDRTRGKFAFTRRERVRFLLKKSFDVTEDKSEWEEALIARLAEAPADGSESRSADAGPAEVPKLDC